MIELQVATIISFIVSLFILYRLLVSKYDRHVKLLQDEIAYKHNYKGRLEELKLFYEEEILMLRDKFQKSEGTNEQLDNQLKQVEIALKEIELQAHSKHNQSSKLESIIKTKEKYYSEVLKNIKNDLGVKSLELDSMKSQYSELVSFIRSKHGVESLLEFHDFNQMEETKIRKKYNREQRFKSKAT